MIYFIYFVFCCGVRCRLKWQRNAWLRYNLFVLFWFRHQPTLRCITQHPLLQKISLQREVLETAFVGLCQVRGTSQSAPPGTDLTLAKFEQICLFNTN